MAASQAEEYYPGGSGKELLESFAAEEIEKSHFQVAKIEWHGKIAEKFELNGEAEKTDFEKVLKGVNPLNGEKLIRHRSRRSDSATKTKDSSAQDVSTDSAEKAENIKAEKIEPEKAATKGKTAEHRACWDITFSAPKSVSLAAIVGGDLRLIEAHRQAVSTALSEVEKFAEARLGGNKPTERTGKLLIASFEHYIARPDKKDNFAAADLHTHNTALNFTFAENDKSYSLQPQKLFEAQKLGTAVYRMELAKGMNDIGYEIRFDRKTKAPEIAAISRQYIEEVSPRQTEIKAKAKELQISSTRQIVVRHRSAKAEKSAGNIEFHRRIEQSFDFQASAAVEKSFVNIKVSQPDIIETLEAEVNLRRTEIFKRAEKRQKYYAAKQSEKQSHEQPGTEGQTQTIEQKSDIGIVAERTGAESRNEASAIAVVPASRNSAIAAERNFDSSDTELRRVTKLRDEIDDRSGSQQTFVGTKHELFAKAERSDAAHQEPGSQDSEDGFENSNSFKRDESSGSENRIELKTNREKSSEFTKSNSSEIIARSRTDEGQAIGQQTADQEITSGSQFVGEPTPAARNFDNKQFDGTGFNAPLRAGQDESQFAIGDESQLENSDTGNLDGTRRNESRGSLGRDLSEVIPRDEADVTTAPMDSNDFDYDIQPGNNIASDFSGGHLLASDNYDPGSDFRDNSDLLDLRYSDVQPGSGISVYNDDYRTDSDLWDDLLPLESKFGRQSVRSGGVELFDAEAAFNELSAANPDTPFIALEAADSGCSQSFAEIEQIFETQKQQETLAAEIIKTANEQHLQNQQAEINQAVQDKMFAYLMQLSESPAQNAASPNSRDTPTLLEVVHQNFLTDSRNLEQFTKSVEEQHFNEEKEKRTLSENLDQNKKAPEQFISNEELEYYEDQPEFEQECIRSLSL